MQENRRSVRRYAKEASDLGIHGLVTFFYAQGLICPTYTEDGWQESYNPHLEQKRYASMPIYNANDEP
jgi:hypothetical protein